ncbi:MAG: hypothetical protein OXC93_12040 [Rhodospirillaceae bacterium]|nr:hypothetical protein [Rhodospirillaceae bacterium]
MWVIAEVEAVEYGRIFLPWGMTVESPDPYLLRFNSDNASIRVYYRISPVLHRIELRGNGTALAAESRIRIADDD